MATAASEQSPLTEADDADGHAGSGADALPVRYRASILSAPQRLGLRMPVLRDPRRVGAVGGLG